MACPSSLAAWLTINRSCNLRCTWCYARGTGFAHDNMSLETVETVLRMLATLPVKTVHLIGGEPTIHPHFFEIIKMVSDAGLTPKLITNSIAFHDKDFLERTIEAGVHGIMTSLKGANGEQYRRHTGVDAFGKVMLAIRNIEAVRLRTLTPHRVAITMCRELFETIDDLLVAMRTSGANEFTIDTERPVFVGGKAQPVQGTTPKEMADLLVRAYPKLKASGVRCFVKISLPFCLFPKDFISELRGRGDLIAGCQLMGGTGIIIDPQGKILPCNHFCDRPIGEITPGFEGEQYRAFREQTRVLGFYRAMASCPNKKCKQCSQWSSCGGGCRVHWFANGAAALLAED